MVNKKASALWMTVLGGVLFATALLCLRYGSAEMSFAEFFNGIFFSEGSEQNTLIIYHVRLPRILGCLLCGVGLSVSGVLLQTVTDNSLASPSLVGVNQGAGFAVVLILSFLPQLSGFLPLISFVGALAVTVFILGLSRALGDSKTSFVLSGIAVGAVFSAGISFFTLLNDQVLSSYNSFSVGSVANLTYTELVFPALMIGVSLWVSLIFSKSINTLLLGDLSASALGVNVKAVRWIAVICSSACAAAVVSFAGLLGFVGLIVPNLARRLVGNNTSVLIVTSALLGGTVVLLADLLGRILISPSEIPVGIMMACVGAPFFLFVLAKKKREGDI